MDELNFLPTFQFNIFLLPLCLSTGIFTSECGSPVLNPAPANHLLLGTSIFADTVIILVPSFPSAIMRVRHAAVAKDPINKVTDPSSNILLTFLHGSYTVSSMQ